MDARRTPKLVLYAHLPDQQTQLSLSRRTPYPSP
jgi:hypothetical protein